jgi:ribonucleoside-diphosphate reductase alpha chain
MICNQASTGVEPIFQWSYKRNDSYGTHDIKHFLLEELDEEGLPDYALTALQIPPEDHVKVQAQIQQYIDSSISKTVNLPKTATKEDVDKVFKQAHESKCKSITVYRSGSRKTEVLVKDKKDAEAAPVSAASEKIDKLRYRERVLFGATIKVNTPGGKAYITVNEDDIGIREVFIHVSKAGSEVTTHVEAEGRLISNALKYGIPAGQMISHLAGHKSNPIFDNGRSIKSVPDAVAQAMQEYIDNYEGFSEFIETELKPEQTITAPEGEISGELCPDCGEVLYMASNCTQCRSCGFSQCG